MTDYMVFHHNNPTFRIPEEEDGAYPVSVHTHKPVAIVQDSDGLGDVFEMTNHIDHDWTKNERVHVFGNGTSNSIRSTSVGDAVLNLETQELLICKGIGWGAAIWTG